MGDLVVCCHSALADSQCRSIQLEACGGECRYWNADTWMLMIWLWEQEGKREYSKMKRYRSIDQSKRERERERGGGESGRI